MSENIQSISQGTYTIGQTSATNFVAGNGIKIDEPSAGTVRIGNDGGSQWVDISDQATVSPGTAHIFYNPCLNLVSLHYVADTISISNTGWQDNIFMNNSAYRPLYDNYPAYGYDSKQTHFDAVLEQGGLFRFRVSTTGTQNIRMAAMYIPQGSNA